MHKPSLRRFRLFVAGASSQRMMVRAVIDDVLYRGHEVTYDWTRAPEWEQELTDEIARSVSQQNQEGVRACDGLLWVVDPAHPSQGAHFEAGLAKGLGKPVAQVVAHPLHVPLEWVHAIDLPVRHGSVISAIETIESELERRERRAEADVPGQILLAEVAL